MEIYRRLEGFFLNLINSLWICFIYIHEIKNIFNKRHLFKNVKLTKEQKKQIDTFYRKNYGRRIPYWWHRLYMSYTGNFNYKYFPEILFSTKVEPLTNRRINVLPFEDKNMLPILFLPSEGTALHIPNTYLMRVNGKYFDENRMPIGELAAVQVMAKLKGEYVVKVSKDSSSGRGVRILNLSEGVDSRTGECTEKIFQQMGNNFVVQERIKPHAAFEKLYSKSINTIRVITYQTEEAIKVAPLLIRIGRGGGEVDNAHAGGIFIGVKPNGQLLAEAFSEYQERVFVHPDSGTVFKDYQLPMIPEICEVAKNLHHNLPGLRFVSWDFTVNSDNRIVLIEANLHSQSLWLPQIAHGEPMFGDDTEEILRLIK